MPKYTVDSEVKLPFREVDLPEKPSPGEYLYFRDLDLMFEVWRVTHVVGEGVRLTLGVDPDAKFDA